ncbi:MAG: beta-ketoacyl synthase N-terminal-like domain-containing protein, partial [Candidatus Limnocylindrales bacterium]
MRAAVSRHVVVTGVGAVTPLGADVPATWERLIAGESGIRAISSFDASRLDCRIAGEALEADPARVLDRKSLRRTDRATQLSLLATQEALADAGLPERL